MSQAVSNLYHRAGDVTIIAGVRKKGEYIEADWSPPPSSNYKTVRLHRVCFEVLCREFILSFSAKFVFFSLHCYTMKVCATNNLNPQLD